MNISVADPTVVLGGVRFYYYLCGEHFEEAERLVEWLEKVVSGPN